MAAASPVPPLPSLISPLKMMHGPSKLITCMPSHSLPSTSMTPSTVYTDTSSVFNSMLRLHGQSQTTEGHHDYVLLFNRSSGSPRVYYMMVHPTRRGRLLPKLNYISLTKVKDVSGYRVVVLYNLLYIIGGRNLESGSIINHCYRFDPRNNQWVRLASLSKARCRHTADALDGYIYVTGGEAKSGRILDTVECYDPATDTWTDMRPMPRPKADHASCVAQGRLFVSGGLGAPKRGQGNNIFWQYEPKSDFWSQATGKSVMPQGRERHLMLEYRGMIYSLCGLTWGRYDSQISQRENPNIFSFDCRGNTSTKLVGGWDEGLPPMRNPRCMASAAVIGHNIFVIGGYNYKTGEYVDTIEYFNTRKKKWYDVFSLGENNFSSVDVAVVRVPDANRWFSHLTPAIQGQWTLW